MKRLSSIEKLELLRKLNGLEQKHKFKKDWDNQVKTMFQSTGSFSFEEMIYKDRSAAEQLVNIFS